MRILHLLSNPRWTERAEPTANLVLAQQRLGHDALFACGKWHPPMQPGAGAGHRAREKGLDPLLFHMDKHLRLWRVRRLRAMLKDLPRLRETIRARNVDVVHAHMLNAHLLAAMAVYGVPAPPVMVRSSYEPTGPEGGFRGRYLLHKRTDGLVVISEQAKRKTVDRFRFSPERIAVIEPGIDVNFFDPERPLAEDRASFGLAPEHFVVGMVTRIRRDRRVDLVVRAMAALWSEYPETRLLLVGHGEELANIRKLVRGLDFEPGIVTPGYCVGDRLAAAYRAMDVLVYPVPGTDQSCRTVREAMASGVPVVASRLGFLPALIDDRVTGRLVELSVPDLADAVRALCADRDALRRMRQAARETARHRFSLSLQAQRTVAFYHDLLRQRRPPFVCPPSRPQTWR